MLPKKVNNSETTLLDLGIDLTSVELVHGRKECLFKKSTIVPKSLQKNELVKLTNIMREVMEKLGGCGLAANQIGVNLALIVTDISVASVIINPEIIYKSPIKVNSVEGCLSLGKNIYKIQRSIAVKVRFEDINRIEKVLLFNGRDAKTLQHEISHTLGLTLAQTGRFNKQKTKIQLQYELLKNARDSK